MGQFLTHLESPWDGSRHEARTLQTTHAGRPLVARYDLERIAREVERDSTYYNAGCLWSFRDLLPVQDDRNIVSFGELATPTLQLARLGEQLGLENLFLKDESRLPTGSFKSRGMSVAISRAKELGVTRVAVPTQGNAGGAMAAYAARAGMEAWVFLPSDTPEVNKLECELAGARVVEVDGLIGDCAALLREGQKLFSWFDLSTLREPYRLEGKKTMGLELAQHFGWRFPEVVLYPTGGGTGLIGMAKAFDELEQLGWIGPARPRFVAVQSEGCAPVVRAFAQGRGDCEPAPNAHTAAAGLRVPKPFADFVILKYLRISGGAALAVSDDDMLAATRELSAATGICACPEGGACLAALRKLAADGWIQSEETVVLFNTGSGLKYAEALRCVTPA